MRKVKRNKNNKKQKKRKEEGEGEERRGRVVQLYWLDMEGRGSARFDVFKYRLYWNS